MWTCVCLRKWVSSSDQNVFTLYVENRLHMFEKSIPCLKYIHFVTLSLKEGQECTIYIK